MYHMQFFLLLLLLRMHGSLACGVVASCNEILTMETAMMMMVAAAAAATALAPLTAVALSIGPDSNR